MTPRRYSTTGLKSLITEALSIPPRRDEKLQRALADLYKWGDEELEKEILLREEARRLGGVHKTSPAIENLIRMRTRKRKAAKCGAA